MMIAEVQMATTLPYNKAAFRDDGWRPSETAATEKQSDSWVQTYRGYALEVPTFECPDEAITVEETAHVLAGINRFGSRTKEPYNVAQHSVLVARWVRDNGGSALEQFQALNHEGDEALLGFDPPAPLVATCPGLAEVKLAAHRRYCRRYGLPEALAPIVKRADLVLLATEKRDLMGPEPRPWRPLPEPLAERIVPWSFEVSGSTFKMWFAELATVIRLPRERW